MIKTLLSTCLIALLVLFFSGKTEAGSKHVRIFLSESAKPAQDDAFWVGQKVPVVIEVLSETHFSGSTRFSLPDIPGAVFYKPEERAIVMSRKIDGLTYSVQRHEFSFYAQRANVFTIPSFSVRFGVAGKLGEAVSESHEKTEPLTIKAILPQGAENFQSLISTTDLKVTESWTPQPTGEFTTGNALKRRITFRASDMPGMAFPQIHLPETEGLRIYRNRAEVQDKITRGSLTGERIDSLTYVCQEAGNYQLPAVKVTWWDLNQQELKTITLPAVTFEVKAASQQTDADQAQNTQTSVSWKWITTCGILLLIIGGLIYWFKDALFHKWKLWQQNRKESEAAYFQRITPTLTPPEMLFAIQQWLTKVPSNTNGQSLEDFAKSHNSPSLQQEFRSLQAAIVGQTTDWDSSKLISSLKQTRQQITQKKKLISKNSKTLTLHHLNPK